MRVDAVLGRFDAPLDLEQRQLSDGGLALLLFQAICKKLDYKPPRYASLEAEDLPVKEKKRTLVAVSGSRTRQESPCIYAMAARCARHCWDSTRTQV